MNFNLASLQPFAWAIGIIILTLILGSIVSRIFRRLIARSLEDEERDPTTYQFFRRFIVTGIYLLGGSLAIYTIPDLRGIAGSMLAGAGLLAVAVGFASQAALSNIISGLFIVIFKPFRVNDRLTLQGRGGTVEDITLRHTVLRDYENRRIIIPNSIISDEVIVNSDFTDGKICKHLHFDISYDSDIDIARHIIQTEALAHPLIRDNRTLDAITANEPQVAVRLINLDQSSVTLRAWCWVDSQEDSFALSCDLLESVKKRFDQEGVEIPFPHRTIVHKNKAV